MAEKTPYSRCFVVENKNTRDTVVRAARERDGAVIEVDGDRVLVFDKVTFDHLDYHYRMKATHLIVVADTVMEAIPAAPGR